MQQGLWAITFKVSHFDSPSDSMAMLGKRLPRERCEKAWLKPELTASVRVRLIPSSNLQVEVIKTRMDRVCVHHSLFTLEPFCDSYHVTFPIFLYSYFWNQITAVIYFWERFSSSSGLLLTSLIV